MEPPQVTDLRSNPDNLGERVAPVTSVPNASSGTGTFPWRTPQLLIEDGLAQSRTGAAYSASSTFIGVVVAGLNFLLQLGHIVWRIVKNPSHDTGDFHLVELSVDEAPSSFLRYVFLNPERYDEDTFHQIVEHEQIHVKQRHSLDLILMELVLIFQWFNPFCLVLPPGGRTQSGISDRRRDT